MIQLKCNCVGIKAYISIYMHIDLHIFTHTHTHTHTQIYSLFAVLRIKPKVSHV
jgi:hypothetical protein